ncbi:MAG: MAPEG family protein [Myxococcota bacterium]|nr:MAPEG family protein [Myxococcota bacterium]
MTIPITGLYLAIFAIFSSILAFFPGRIRGGSGISIGDGGRPDLLLAMRRHGNFVEYVPLILIMLAALELNGASATLLHGLGLSLLVARILHAVGLKADTIQSIPRGIGAAGTLLVTLVAAGVLAYQFLGA